MACRNIMQRQVKRGSMYRSRTQHISRQAVVATLKYVGYKTVNDVSLPSKKMEKEELGTELFSKEYVKIKDPNELISKGNLTDSDK